MNYNLKNETINEFFSKNSRILGRFVKISKVVIGAGLISASISSNANADAVELANGGASALAQLNDPADTVTFAGAAQTHTIDLDDGAITIATLTSDTNAANVLTVSDTNGTKTFTVTGLVQADQDFTITTTDNGQTLSFGGSITDDGDGTDIIIALDGTVIGEFTGTAANIDAAVNGVGIGDGTLNISGTVTMDGAVGAGAELGTLNVSGATTFNAAVEAQVATFTADTTIGVDSELGAATITDATVTVLADITDVASDGAVAAITLNDTASTASINFKSTANETITTTIAAAADGEGNITIAEGAGAAPKKTTISGIIGTDGVRIGSINVGTSTLGGSADFQSATFTDALVVEGGDDGAEDSILDVGATLGATNGITLTKGAGDAELNVTAAVTVTGAIDASGSGAGSAIIDIDEDVTFASAIGATTAVTTIEVVTAKTATFQGNVSATTATLAGTANATFDAGAAQTFTGTIAAAVDGEGTVNNANTDGEVTFDGAIGTENLRMLSIVTADGAITTFNNAIFAETLDVNGNASGEDITLEAAGNIIGTDATGGVANAGALDFAGGNNIELGTAIGSGSTVFDVKETVAAVGGVVIGGNITVKPSANFTSGTITFIDGDFNAISNDEQARVLVQDTALTDFTVTAGAQDVTIAAAAKSDTTTATELGTTINQAKSLRQAMESANSGSSSDSAALTALNDSLVVINGRTATEDTDLAKQVAPQTDMISGSTCCCSKAVTGSVTRNYVF